MGRGVGRSPRSGPGAWWCRRDPGRRRTAPVQAQASPSRDDHVLAAAGVRLQDPLLHQVVADRGGDSQPGGRSSPPRPARLPAGRPVGTVRPAREGPAPAQEAPRGPTSRTRRDVCPATAVASRCVRNLWRTVEMRKVAVLGLPEQPLSSSRRQTGAAGHSSPRMKASTRARPSSSGSCTGGDFMRYDDAEMIGPPRPRSLAILAARIASMMMPAELGESQTSSLYSRLSGTSPKARPSRRT